MSAHEYQAAQRITSILDGQPFHLMYEESKGVLNLNPLLRSKLGGREENYPELAGKKCDVVFLWDGAKYWMEVKQIQTHNGGNKDHWRFTDRNPNFKKHLGIREAKHHSAVRDVRDRLPTLDGYSSADHLAFLAMIYDSPRFPIDDYLAEFERLGRLRNWSKYTLISQPDPRPRAQVEQARIIVMYWERPTIPA